MPTESEENRRVGVATETTLQERGVTMQKNKKKIRSILLQLTKDRSREHSSQRADEVGEALRRLVVGAYGICVDCSGNIPEARLSAKPEAARCLDCQSAREGTPVEV